jgi:hypothetical protein
LTTTPLDSHSTGGVIEQSVCTSIYRVNEQAHQNSTEILKDAGVALTRAIVLDS